MSIQEMKELLERAGIPVSYSHFNTPQKLPYVCFMVSDENGFSADGVRYYKADSYRIEMYTATKDLALEEAIETALGTFFFTKSSTWIAAERCFMTVYEMEV